MPIKILNVKCNRCGKTEEIATNRESVSYWLCSQCKSELERSPKELMRHVGRSVEEDFRSKEQ